MSAKTIKSYPGNQKYNLTDQESLNIISVNKKNYLIKENVESQNVNQLNLSKEYESIYLHEIGFRKRSQFELLREWYKKFWDNELFIKVSYDWIDFSKRIIIIEPGKTSSNGLYLNKIINNNEN